jgi:hypothetical protein
MRGGGRVAVANEGGGRVAVANENSSALGAQINFGDSTPYLTYG